MSELRPTKTRLALLRDIASDEVTLFRGEFHHDNGRKVTAAVQEQIKAGWADVGRARGWNAVFRPVRATEHGYHLLAEHFPEQWGDLTPAAASPAVGH